MEIKRIIITGSEGYIGTVLKKQLLDKNYTVTGIDTCYFGSESIKNPNYNLIKKDIRNLSSDDIKGADAIIHLAALSNDPMGAIRGELTQEINFESTVRIAKMAKQTGVNRFIFSSSCSVYGIAENGYVDDNSAVHPLTEYAISKIKSEEELVKMADKTFVVGLLRNSTVYGYSPNFRSDLVVNNLLLSAITTHIIKIMSDGTPWRPLIDVRDLSMIFEKFLWADPKLINSEIFNIGFSENNFQVNQIAETVAKAVPGCQVTYTGEHGADSRSYRVNFDKLKNIFPDLKQFWTINKSVTDMFKKLSDEKLRNSLKGLVRLNIMKNLMDSNKIDDNLFWKTI